MKQIQIKITKSTRPAPAQPIDTTSPSGKRTYPW